MRRCGTKIMGRGQTVFRPEVPQPPETSSSFRSLTKTDLIEIPRARDRQGQPFPPQRPESSPWSSRTPQNFLVEKGL